MRGNRLMALVVCVGGLSLACGLLGDGSAAVEKIHQFADEACACPTLECLKEVQTRQAKFFKEQGDEVVAAGERGRDAIETSARQMADCATKLAKGEGPSAEPESKGQGGGKKGKKGKKGKGGKKGRGNKNKRG